MKTDHEMEEWAAPPLIPGSWKNLPLSDCCALLARLSAAELELNMEPTAFLVGYKRVRATVMTNIANWLLIEAEAMLPDERLGYRAFFYGPGTTLIPVQWTSTTSLELYRKTPKETRTPEFLRTYLKIFSSLMVGEGGRFITIESLNELDAWHDGTTEIPAVDAGSITPIEVLQTADGFKAKAQILYGGQVFRAEFLIPDDGAVEMLDDHTLFEVNPRREDFRGPFRLMAAP